ncbi:putative protein with domain of unknown function (DUF3395) [Lyophyllum shimeji]|uniref:J domain-containing protein n=1 Tax=Lyophyllum shimeji TaxID=47721 RepID=A0A9P3PMN1_LYOSH|nr:putative protein with domain of unknown function (DUF3395) [Lyophyllum shimeji]
MEGGSSKDVRVAETDFYYSVLNLPRTASQSEITERYRALSLIFHPDRQQDQRSKETATKKFLEIQKAYEVLSDPFLREVYDALGEKGLAVIRSPQFRSIPRDEAKKLVTQLKGEIAFEALREKGFAGGSLTCGIDAVSLCGPYLGSQDDPLVRRILNRFEDVRLLTFALRHEVQKSINESTDLSGKATMTLDGGKLRNTLVGTVRHQFSPRFTSEFSVGVLPQLFQFTGIYNEAGTTISAQVSTPLAFRTPVPSVKLSISRQLFRHRLETAALEVDVGRRPHFAFNLVFPKVFGVNAVPEEGRDPSVPPSSSGLKIGTTHTLIGFAFDTFLPKLVAEWGVTFAELGVQLKVALELGLEGLGCVYTGKWSPRPATSFAVASHLHPTGVVFRLDAAYYEQQITMPIVLSTEYSPGPALFTAVLPSTAFVLGYHYIIKPRRRKQRLASIRAARQALEEETGMGREREAVAGLLKDAARKSKQTETSKGGLVILEASWGSSEKEDGARDLVMDVTVPLQALVHSSQLYIPSDRTKSNIRGFSDPAPFAPKVLHVRYQFRGKTHYAEIPEDMPVVLPLAEHLVE